METRKVTGLDKAPTVKELFETYLSELGEESAEAKVKCGIVILKVVDKVGKSGTLAAPILVSNSFDALIKFATIPMEVEEAVKETIECLREVSYSK